MFLCGAEFASKKEKKSRRLCAWCRAKRVLLSEGSRRKTVRNSAEKPYKIRAMVSLPQCFCLRDGVEPSLVACTVWSMLVNNPLSAGAPTAVETPRTMDIQTGHAVTTNAVSQSRNSTTARVDGWTPHVAPHDTRKRMKSTNVPASPRSRFILME